MKVEKTERVGNSGEVGVLAFVAVLSGVVFGIGLGPLAGIASGVGGFIAGYATQRKEVAVKARRLANPISDADLTHASRAGQRKFSVRTELTNDSDMLSPLGRLVFGDTLTKETTYYLDD